VGLTAVWTGAENLVPTGIRSPDRPTRRQSLYRLRYPALCVNYNSVIFKTFSTLHGLIETAGADSLCRCFEIKVSSNLLSLSQK
jgi:hypothetical protein